MNTLDIYKIPCQYDGDRDFSALNLLSDRIFSPENQIKDKQIIILNLIEQNSSLTKIIAENSSVNKNIENPMGPISNTLSNTSSNTNTKSVINDNSDKVKNHPKEKSKTKKTDSTQNGIGKNKTIFFSLNDMFQVFTTHLQVYKINKNLFVYILKLQ